MTSSSVRTDSSSGSSPSPPPSIPSLRALLLGLLLTCLVPGLAGVGVLIYRVYDDGRRQIERDNVQTARAMVAVVDRQLDAAKIAAVALASSSFMASTDWPAFHRRASELIKSEGFGTNVVVSDADGQQLVNTTVPWGTPLPKHAAADEVRRVFATGKPLVTRVFQGAVTGRPRLVVMVPVLSGNRVVYALGISIGTDQFEPVLREQRLPADWVSSISDASGIIAVRSIQGEKFSGQPVNPEITRRLQVANEGAFESVTKEGVPALIVFSRSPTSLWTIALAIPLAPLQANLKRNLILLGAGGLFLLSTGAWFARRLGQRIAGSVQALTDSARALASGEGLRPFDAGFREAAEASEAMARTSELLSQRARALAAAQATLREHDAVLADAQRIAHIGSWYWDARTQRTIYSDEMCRIFGRETIPPMAEQCGELYPLQSWQRLSLAKQQVAVDGTSFELELPALFADGSPIWVGARAEAVRSASGEIVGVRGSLQDITGRKRAEADEQRMAAIEAENRQMQETSRLKSEFLANMSHELRTPLNAVIGFADLLHSGAIKPDSPKHQLFLGHIGTSGRHLLQLINDVLDLSKVESGKFQFYPEQVALGSVLNEVKDILATEIGRKGISLSVDIDPDLADVTLDPARLKQVLFNFLSNAIKFTAQGGRVTVRALSAGPEHFRIEVEDSGIGISAADLPRLFTEFQQLDSGYSKQHQGTGLGLALTRRLVQEQGGTVGVRSTPGVGSLFFAVLNRTHGMDTARLEASAQGPRERDAERVLVIEDDPRDQALLVEALSRAGFEVDGASESLYAVRRARETVYAALTLDLGLPDKRGFELLDDIRQSGASYASPVVGVTMPTDSNLSATFAIANVLCKPIRSDEILAAMACFRLAGDRRAHVMVIDDDAASLDLMRATLASIGIDAACFQDGRIALQEVQRRRPDAIVLDLMMPAFDGFQVLDALQRLPSVQDVPVFIWTSMLLTDAEYASLARSARAILIKGGGAMEAVLESVRRWRRPAVSEPEVGR
jgi:signal transduction histidine kinase/DNA-binding response OmpR family regulator